MLCALLLLAALVGALVLPVLERSKKLERVFSYDGASVSSAEGSNIASTGGRE